MNDFHIERLIYVLFVNFQVYDQTHHHLLLKHACSNHLFRIISFSLGRV